MSSGIDSGVIKFIIALFVVAFLIEAVGKISPPASWTLAALIIIGILINNPLAIGLITAGANSLGSEAS